MVMTRYLHDASMSCAARFLSISRVFAQFTRNIVSSCFHDLINKRDLLDLWDGDKLMDQLNLYWTGGAELLDMMPQLHRTGRNTSTLDETADGYGVNPFPIGQCLSPLPGESPTAHTKPKRKAPKTAKDLQKKREYDRAYRRRCRENKRKTEQELFVLIEENKKLIRENDYFKREEVKLQEMVQSQKDEMTLLQNKLRQQKAQLQGQNVVVDVLSKKVASIDDNMDPQSENKRLKLEMDLQIKKINNDDYLNLIQLRAKNIELEQEKNDLQLIIDALCAKINKDNDLEPKQAS